MSKKNPKQQQVHQIDKPKPAHTADLTAAAAGALPLIFSTTHQIASHEGPLPSPEVLKGYEQAFPGLADRVVKMAEEEATHRREMEKIVI